MTREDFLRELRIALQGRIPQGEVNSQLSYYETYIIEESRKGRSESEVIESLGDPRLIAKTIIDTYGSGYYEDGGAQISGKKKKAGGSAKYVRLLSFLFFIAVAALLIKIGIFLLPLLLAAVCTGAAVYFLYVLFFGNRK